MNFHSLENQYRSLLLDGIVPFWFKHGIDWINGGVTSCMTEDGYLIIGDKYIWSQARSAWVFSALYNRVESRPEFLAAAENSIRFLFQHGRDAQGRWVYHTDQEGNVLEGPISIYTDCYAVYGLSEYYRATKEEKIITLARETFNLIRQRINSPDFKETAPYMLPPNRKIHGIPMVMTDVSNELAQTTGESDLEIFADEYAAEVMDHFVSSDNKLLFEFLSDKYENLPPPEGTYVQPGHAIESMWFVLHLARRRNNRELIRKAVDVIRWHLEAGWDSEHGGIFLGLDSEGNSPYLPNSDKKVWWPHVEALYALLLAYQLTGESWCLDWYQKVHDWSFGHFSMPEIGEWRQRLDRTGQPVTNVIGLPVKDPFHLPRAAILILQLLSASQYLSFC